MSQSTAISITISRDTHKKLGVLADDQHRSMSSEIAFLVDKEIESLNLKVKEATA